MYIHVCIYMYVCIHTIQVYRSKAESSISSELSEVFLKRRHRDEIARVCERAKQNVIFVSEQAAGFMAVFSVRWRTWMH